MKLTMKKKADVMLFITASGWAMSTILIKLYIDAIPVFHLMFGRYAIAFLVITIFQSKHIKKIEKKDIMPGIILGVLTFLAFTFAIASLSYTSASKSGFFVAMSVLFVPIVSAILKRKLPNIWINASVLMAIIGLLMISGMNGGGFNRGDFLALLCAASYTIYIMIQDRVAKHIDEAQLSWMQMGVVTIISLVCMLFLEGFEFQILAEGFLPILAIGILGTAITNFAQIRAQKHATPESVGLILLGEPLFTLLMAMVILKEEVLLTGLIGAALLLSALIVTVLKDI